MDFYDILLAKKLNGEGGGDSTGIIVTEETLPNGGIVKHIEGQVISGTKQISSNGEFDVAAYKSVNVNVSGGGSTELSPKLSLTVVPSGAAASVMKDILYCDGWYCGIKDGKIYGPDWDEFNDNFITVIQQNSSDTVTIYLAYIEENYVVAYVGDIITCNDPSGNIIHIQASNADNCEYDDDSGYLVFTDPSKNASITLSIQFYVEPIT